MGKGIGIQKMRKSSSDPELHLEAGRHLARVDVRDFKSLAAQTLDLGAVNVFIGANGSGKSNVLEAIGLAGAAVAGRVDDQALLRRGVRPGVPALYKSSFTSQRIASKISINARSADGVEYHAYLTNPIRKPRPYWVFGNESLNDETGRQVASRGPRGRAKVGRHSLALENHASIAVHARADQEISSVVRRFLDALSDFAIFSPVTPVLRGIAPDTAPRSPVGLYGGQLPEAVGLLMGSKNSVMRADVFNLIDWAERVECGEPSRDFLSPSVSTTRLVLKFHDRFMARGRNTLSAYDASEGALYVLFMLVLAAHPQSPTSFAVDNFDQALNPRTARALTRLFVREVLARGRQALLTTHNPLVLDGLPLDDERVRLFAVDRNRRGHTVVRRISADLARAKQTFGDDALSRLWVMGRFGGVPNV